MLKLCVGVVVDIERRDSVTIDKLKAWEQRYGKIPR
jgi:hypothetical protein